MKYIAIFTLALSLTVCSSVKTAKEPFSVELNSVRLPAGTVDAQFDRFLFIGGLKKDNITVEYFPREDAVCLQYRKDFITYYQFWDNDARDAFLTALGKYKEDYTTRKLGKGGRKTKRNYGSVESYLIWQSSSFTVQAKAPMNIEMGYFFKDNAPFFTINQGEADYEDPVTRDSNRTSQEITIYFTRAQADNLAALFDPYYLRGLITTDIGTTNVELDEY